MRVTAYLTVVMSMDALRRRKQLPTPHFSKTSFGIISSMGPTFSQGRIPT